jgi:hypothetical protein
LRTPGDPVTGSQRPLQHCAAAVQLVPEPVQAPVSTHSESTQNPLQH